MNTKCSNIPLSGPLGIGIVIVVPNKKSFSTRMSSNWVWWPNFSILLLLLQNSCYLPEIITFLFTSAVLGDFVCSLATKAFLKHSFKAFHFESFFTTWPEDPSLSTQQLEVLWGLTHSFWQNGMANGEVSPLGPGYTHKERDWGKMVATTFFSSKGNKVNTINL